MVQCGTTPYFLALIFAFIFYELLLCETLATAKLKHSHHQDVRSQFLGEEELSLYENYNNKPVFSNCSNYAPVIKEEEPIGTVVIQVLAEDKDPPEKGGTITYNLMNKELLKFEINSKTGVIRTTQILDRDEPAKEKYFYLTIVAADNGEPRRYDICTFKVTIEDVNDNSPVFNNVAYPEFVLQELPVGHEIMRVFATDIDDGNNSVIQYSLSFTRPNDAEYFRIERENGIIFLNKRIDRDLGYKFNMSITAKNIGEIPNFSVINVPMVVKSYLKAPVFVLKPTEPIILEENFNDFNTPITYLKANCNVDKPNQSDNVCLYSIVGGNTKHYNKFFRLERNKGIMELKLSSNLNYEDNTQHTIIVQAMNEYQLATKINITIIVKDVNDNKPIFHNIETASVFENEPPGTFVIQVLAIDADGTSANNQVRYKLDTYQDLFEINPQTGIITTLVSFDREDKDSYRIEVIAMDNSPSALFENFEHNKAQLIFIIKIADKNDNPPYFTQKVYTSKSIYENANINSFVINVKAFDLDTVSLVTYNIISGNPDNSFRIEPRTGMIYVNKQLDYEKITNYNLIVRASDGVFNDTSHVDIYIKNVNDSAPIIQNFNKNPIIEEEKSINVLKVVIRSTSVQFYGITAKKFVELDETGVSKKEIFQEMLASIFNVSVKNVYIFSVLNSSHSHHNRNLLDVRFSVQDSSSYFAPEKLNTIIAQHFKQIEQKIKANILLININECLLEKVRCNSPCRNFLNISTFPYPVFTNTFVDVRAVIDPLPCLKWWLENDRKPSLSESFVILNSLFYTLFQ